jgi:hypothetical protein
MDLTILFSMMLTLPSGVTAQNDDIPHLTVVAPALNVLSGPGVT